MSRRRTSLKLASEDQASPADRRTWARFLRASAAHQEGKRGGVVMSPTLARAIANELWPDPTGALATEAKDPSEAAKFAASDPNIFPGITE